MDSRLLTFLFFILFGLLNVNAQNNCTLTNAEIPSPLTVEATVPNAVIVAPGQSFSTTADSTVTFDTNSSGNIDFIGCIEDTAANTTTFYFTAPATPDVETLTYDNGAVSQTVTVTAGGEGTPAPGPPPSTTRPPTAAPTTTRPPTTPLPTTRPPTPSPPTPSPPTPSPPTPSPPTPSPPTPRPPTTYPPTKDNCAPPPPHSWGGYPAPPSYPSQPSYPQPGVVGAANNNGGRILLPGVVNGGLNVRPAVSTPVTAPPVIVNAPRTPATAAPVAAGPARVLIPPIVTVYPANGASRFAPGSAPVTSPPTSRPTTQRPTTQRPTTQRPTTQKPTTQKPTTPTARLTTTSRPTIGVRTAPVATPAPPLASTNRKLFPFP